MIETCQICGNNFHMGYNGTVHGCDNCTGAQRDNTDDNAVWMPGEVKQSRYIIASEKIIEITREEAFKK